MHLFIREESNPKCDQTVLTIIKKHGIDTTCVQTAEDLFKTMRKDSNLQDEMKFLHHEIPIFKGPLKHAIWIHDIRMNAQQKFKIRIVQMSLRPELYTCECKDLNRERRYVAMIVFMKSISL